jgi:hypothetical protein
MERDHRLLASLGYDADLDLPLPDIEDGIRRVSLREDLLIVFVARHVAAAIRGAKEFFDVERRGSRSLGHGLVSDVLDWRNAAVARFLFNIERVERHAQDMTRLGLGTGRPSLDLGVAFVDGLRERFRSVDPASPPEYRRGRKAGAPAACIDDARALDPEAGFLESGVEFGRRKRRWWRRR